MEPGRVVVDHLWERYRRKTARGLIRRGEPKWALQDVSFTVEPGDLVGVIGGNGSGKTTLLQSLTGVLKPSRGTVTTTGRVISLVDIAAGGNRELTGYENLMVVGVLLGLRRSEIRARMDLITEFSGLDDEVLSAPMRTYSMGMVLRTAFALVAATEPSVLALDEVLAVGDEDFQRRAMDRVDKLRARGMAAVVVSHHLEMVAERCERVLILERGRVINEGPPGEMVAFYRARLAEGGGRYRWG